MTTDEPAGVPVYKRLGLLLGPAIFVTMMLSPAPAELGEAGWRTAAVGLWMAVWWATEAIPVAVTAMLPLVLFPLLGIRDMRATAAPFANPIIYLFLGGFLVALAIERWNLHRRIALSILHFTGANARSLVGGFMLAAAVLSMWVTNTSTTLMILPIAISVIAVINGSLTELSESERNNFQVSLLLGVAYGATIGGMATLVGTPPNAFLASFMKQEFQVEIGFGQWMLVGLPLTAVMLPLAWQTLTRLAFPVSFRTSGAAKEHLEDLRGKLGPMTVPEKRVGMIFAAMAITWICRPLLNKVDGLEGLTDPGIAMAAGIALFLIPCGIKKGRCLMNWQTAERLPWAILLLFGGGLTLAGAVSESGLATWLGNNLSLIAELPLGFLVAAVATLIIFLTELTSNLATTATFLPVVAELAAKGGYQAITLTAPVALAASCAFMLPVATPPNAIVFGSGLVKIPQMVKAGALLNLIGIVVVSLVAVFLAPRFL